MVDKQDVNLLFHWSNDKTVRENSYNQNAIEYRDHLRWFNEKLNSDSCSIYIFINQDNHPVGQVRIEKDMEQKHAIIGIIVNPDNRGRGYSSEMIERSSADFLLQHPDYRILAYIKQTNNISYSSFTKAGYKLLKEEIFKDIPSYILYKTNVE